MTDDLRSTIEAATAAAETATKEGTAMPETVSPAPAPAPAAPAPAPEQKPGEPAPGVKDQATSAQKPETPPGEDPTKVTETDVKAQKPEDAPVSGIEKAPQSWKPSEKAKWAALDPGVRSEIVRRERETARVLQEAAGPKKFAAGFAEAIKPYEARWRAAGVPPAQVVSNLMRTDHMLATSPPQQKAKLAAQFLKDYGVDIEMLDAELSGQARPDPMEQVDRLVQERLAPFQEFVQQSTAQQQAAVQRDFEQQQAAVEKMTEDPRFPLFDMVREDMADVIENNLRRGVVVPVEEAYNRAVRMNPEAFEEFTKASKQTSAQAAHSTAQRALGASLSVSGGASSRAAVVPSSDLRGTIEAALLAQSGR